MADEAPVAPAPCDNHPDEPSVLTTDGGGAFQEISLCDRCIPASLRHLLGQ